MKFRQSSTRVHPTMRLFLCPRSHESMFKTIWYANAWYHVAHNVGTDAFYSTHHRDGKWRTSQDRPASNTTSNILYLQCDANLNAGPDFHPPFQHFSGKSPVLLL